MKSAKALVPDKRPREAESFPGAPERLCGNCAHFDCGDVRKVAGVEGVCRNGISGRNRTTASHGCGHGFHPDPHRWTLVAGPGGIFQETKK